MTQSSKCREAQRELLDGEKETGNDNEWTAEGKGERFQVAFDGYSAVTGKGLLELLRQHYVVKLGGTTVISSQAMLPCFYFPKRYAAHFKTA